jgi:hypothetical protein
MKIDLSTAISFASAVIAVIAAIYAARQARAAKRQADAAHGEVQPTFHYDVHEDNGRPPWGFRLKIRNYNRRPLRVKEVRVRIPDDLTVWDPDDSGPDSIRKILEAAARPRGEASFKRDIVLEGVSPNAGSPTMYDSDFHIGPRHGGAVEKQVVKLPISIEWEYASGITSPQTEKMTVTVPISAEQTG